jgi:hypothetical protein
MTTLSASVPGKTTHVVPCSVQHALPFLPVQQSRGVVVYSVSKGAVTCGWLACQDRQGTCLQHACVSVCECVSTWCRCIVLVSTQGLSASELVYLLLSN